MVSLVPLPDLIRASYRRAPRRSPAHLDQALEQPDGLSVFQPFEDANRRREAGDGFLGVYLEVQIRESACTFGLFGRAAAPFVHCDGSAKNPGACSATVSKTSSAWGPLRASTSASLLRPHVGGVFVVQRIVAYGFIEPGLEPARCRFDPMRRSDTLTT